MNKEELIHMHTFMVLMKDFFEKKGKGEFSKYYSLQISPLHVHRHKNEHKNAIFTLGKEILSAIRDDDDSNMTIYDPNNIIKYEKIGDIRDDDDSNMTIYDPNNIIKYEKIGDIRDDDDSNMTIYDPNNIIKYEKIEIKK